MRLFIDSANLQEVKRYYSYGIIEGVTTNPSLVAHQGGDFYRVIAALFDIVPGNISVEVVAPDCENMLQEAKKLLAISDKVVIKLPITMDGLKACRILSNQGVRVNMTLCFSENQGLMAALAGAFYISPFIGRLDDIGEDGLQLVRNLRKIYDNGKFGTKILAASVRTLEHVKEVAIIGADYATLSPKILSEMVEHKLTEAGIKKFNDDWQRSGMMI